MFLDFSLSRDIVNNKNKQGIKSSVQKQRSGSI